MKDQPNRLIIVTGLSGAGRNSGLRALEDIGYEAVDNPPLAMVETLARGDRPLAVGIDSRTRDFSVEDVLSTINRLRSNDSIHPELLFLTASPEALQRRFSETRRRHPLALTGRVTEGIDAEQALTLPLRNQADWVIDTSQLSLTGLRQIIEQRFGLGGPGMTITLVSFGFPSGLPQEADLVIDVRFLRNPHYIPDLREKTGLDPAVRTYISEDPDFPEFYERVGGLIEFLLPRFVREGKKYVMIAIGCTGGKHRSVSFVEMLGTRLSDRGWGVLIEHRNLDIRAVHARRQNASGNVAIPPIPGVEQ